MNEEDTTSQNEKKKPKKKGMTREIIHVSRSNRGNRTEGHGEFNSIGPKIKSCKTPFKHRVTSSSWTRKTVSEESTSLA